MFAFSPEKDPAFFRKQWKTKADYLGTISFLQKFIIMNFYSTFFWEDILTKISYLQAWIDISMPAGLKNAMRPQKNLRGL